MIDLKSNGEKKTEAVVAAVGIAFANTGAIVKFAMFTKIMAETLRVVSLGTPEQILRVLSLGANCSRQHKNHYFTFDLCCLEVQKSNKLFCI